MTRRGWPARFALPLIATLVALAATAPTPARVDAGVRLPPIVVIPVAQRTLTYLLVGEEALTDRIGLPPEVVGDDAEIQERMNWAHEVDQELIPYVRSLPEFAGVWIDQQNHGRVVVMLTTVRPETRRRIGDLLPLPGRGLEVRTAKFSHAALLRAFERSSDAWEAHSPVTPHSVALDESRNRLLYMFVPTDVEEATRYLKVVDEAVGVPGAIEGEEIGRDAGSI